jgi:hypothetical protein
MGRIAEGALPETFSVAFKERALASRFYFPFLFHFSFPFFSCQARLDGEPHIVVGILRADFRFPSGEGAGP